MSEGSDELKEVMERAAFFEAAMDPVQMDDEMHFHLTGGENVNVGGERAFSEEGFQALGYQMHDWVMARTLSFYRRHGRFPTGLRAEVKLAWDDAREAEELAHDSMEPWWQQHDDGPTTVTLDGIHRFSPFIRKRREDR